VPVTAADVRRVVHRVGLDRMDDLRYLAGNVAAASGWPTAGQPPFFDRFDEVARSEDLSQLDPPLTGGEVMAHLGLDAGPLVGQAVRYLRERRLDDGPLSAEAARAALDRWLRNSVDGGRSAASSPTDEN
jgi:hypothetical protein